MVSGVPGLSITATSTSVPAVYPVSITADTLAANNYTFNLVAGSLTVTQATTGTVVTSNNGSSAFGQSVTFTAMVTPTSGSGPTGTVQFEIDGSNVGTPAAVSGGTATYSTSTLSVGSHSVVAVYSGNTNFAGSTSPTIVETVVDVATWSGGGIDGNWSTTANWGGKTLAATYALGFSGSTRLSNTNDLPAGTQFTGFTFNAGAGQFILSGNAVNLVGDITNKSATTQTINLPLVLVGGSQTVSAASGNIVISGPISESGGSRSFTKTGPGEVTLSGSNNYTGGTFVTCGTLVVTASSALPNGGALTVGAGATFIFDPSSSASSVATSSVSEDTSAATFSNTSVETTVPTSTSPVPSSVVLLAPATPCAASVSDLAGVSLLQSSATLVTPVTLPLLATSPSTQKHDLDKSALAGDLGTPAVNRLVGLSTAKKIAADLAWLGQAANGSDNWDQRHKKDVATVALDAVFAEYGR